MSHRPQALPEFAVFCHSAGSLWMDLRTLHLHAFMASPMLACKSSWREWHSYCCD